MQIVTVADRPDLAPVVAEWLWEAFWRKDGRTLDAVQAWVEASTARSGTPQCFVALVDGQPVGTASFADSDLDERPELTPWLAGVYVVPAARGQDHASRLVGCVEGACREAGVPTLWLYTTRAEGLYLKLHWRTVETLERPGKLPAIVMCKDL